MVEAFAHILALRALDAPRQAVSISGLVNDAKIPARALREDIAALLKCGGERAAAVGGAPKSGQFGGDLLRVDAAALGGALLP